MASVRERCILPLPPDVVAQIKSSTAIVSLAGVVLELLKNALDAGAAKIEATVDFGRGSCSVEDDGRGIAPLEFGEEGGLGKLYYTSKHYSHEPCLGRNGTFLASLAAMSLLTLTSHHHEHRSHNSITFHHSKTIDRQLPAPPHLELSLGKHGTRVSVRNLFGNLPVRVKQRAAIMENKTEYDRLWDALKRDATGLMLSWRGSVSLRVKDADNRTTFQINGQRVPASTIIETKASSKQRSRELQFVLNSLTQCNYISIDEWPAWVPVSASTSNISIKGAISLEPAPTKNVQFISLGIRLLSSNSGHNELYEEINRMFALSSFGTIEDDGDVDEVEKVRRQNDSRFKSDGFTNRQLKSRKGVDRFPMFHLRILLKDKRESKESDDRVLDNVANFQAVLEVLNAMVTQWLSAHHFQPRKRSMKQYRLDIGFSPLYTNEIDEQEVSSTSVMYPQATQRRVHHGDFTLPPNKSRSSLQENRKRKRATTSPSERPSKRTQLSLFSGWSRIKSSTSAFHGNTRNLEKQDTQKVAEQSSPTHISMEQSNTHVSTLEGVSTLETANILIGTANVSTDLNNATPLQILSREKSPCSDHNLRDETILWTDPSTRETFLLNGRTGCVMPSNSTNPCTKSSIPDLTNSVTQLSKSLRIRPKSTGIEEGKNSWLHGLLQTWDNPVFKPAEKRITQMSLGEHQTHMRGHQQSCHVGCSRVDIKTAFNELSLSSANRVSKTSLQSARIIAQLDKKFILVKVSSCSDLALKHDQISETLVIIDQHAADERIRVEELFAGLCAPLPNDTGSSHYRSKLGHRAHVSFTILERPLHFNVSCQERSLFTTHAARFGAWGMLYDISITAKTSNEGRSQTILSVTTLPPSIVERCKADPQLLISFLRSTVWKYAEDPHLPPLFDDTSSPSQLGSEESPLWLRRLGSCPQGLIDFVNSRACRSAIMFNDELSMQQCEELVTKLSRCVFPFMCAHGRPSMVPLINLGLAEGRDDLSFSLGSRSPEANGMGGTSGTSGFVHAWKQWKKL